MLNGQGVGCRMGRRRFLAAHVKDTLSLVLVLWREVVEYVARQGKRRVQDLIDLGVQFDRSIRFIRLRMEGGPQQRILHHADLLAPRSCGLW